MVNIYYICTMKKYIMKIAQFANIIKRILFGILLSSTKYCIVRSLFPSSEPERDFFIIFWGPFFTILSRLYYSQKFLVLCGVVQDPISTINIHEGGYYQSPGFISLINKLVVGVHWFPLRLGITLLWLNLMICHSNYCFQAIVSY